jgi:hypothetical protein
MKKIFLNAVTASQIVILLIGLTFVSCLKIEETPTITTDPQSEPIVIIKVEDELAKNIAMVKAFSFDVPNLEENEDDLISIHTYFYSQNKAYGIVLPYVVDDEKLRKLSDIIDNGTVSNPDAKVACLQYYRAYNAEGKCIGYFEWGYYSPNDEDWNNIKIWYADSDVTYTSDEGELIFRLERWGNWNGLSRIWPEYGDNKFGDTDISPEWRFTEF